MLAIYLGRTLYHMQASRAIERTPRGMMRRKKHMRNRWKAYNMKYDQQYAIAVPWLVVRLTYTRTMVAWRMRTMVDMNCILI